LCCFSAETVLVLKNLPTTINGIVLVNGLFNIIDKPTHFDKHTGNISLLDPIFITDSIQVIDSDTVKIDRQISDHDGTCVTFKCEFSNQKTVQRTIWDYQNETKNDWEKLINDELDVNNACSNVTDAFLTIAKECIPTRGVTIRTDDKMWLSQKIANKTYVIVALTYN
jgi:hypothetical protein